ncbi:hypothetical protein Tco_0840049 [Tanacetum coccineum]|uniref:RNA-directed DNA polymerase, eukaryota, reverse transcriptase zinc-binding domain protein n=1 Tax=Tanacetum coccineum TaxID=301880 RepID=A0ABQ5AV34_9ASTR
MVGCSRIRLKVEVVRFIVYGEVLMCRLRGLRVFRWRLFGISGVRFVGVFGERLLGFWAGVSLGFRREVVGFPAWGVCSVGRLEKSSGVSSFFALNRALLFKWVWRYLSHDNSLWSRIISALHGLNGHVLSAAFNSTWSSIITEVNSLKVKGVDLISHCKIRVGKGTGTSFWKDLWIGDNLLKLSFPRLFALEENKDISVADKLKINILKSQVMGVGVPHNIVVQAADLIECIVMRSPFRYLGVMVGECMSRRSAWANTVYKLQLRLSKWKVKTLSIGGRLTLLKSVLGASPLYNLSIFKVPKGVLKDMESIRSHFFNGADSSDRKITWVAWDNVIQALYGPSFDLHASNHTSIWCSILREVRVLKDKGFDFISHCKRRVGDGLRTRFWNDLWISDGLLYDIFPRLFALEMDKEVLVAVKLGASSVADSFRRGVRDGTERQQWSDLSSLIDSVSLSSSKDRWICDLMGDGEFKVKAVRNSLDDLFLPSQAVATRWVKFIPIKMWRTFIMYCSTVIWLCLCFARFVGGGSWIGKS